MNHIAIGCFMYKGPWVVLFSNLMGMGYLRCPWFSRVNWKWKSFLIIVFFTLKEIIRILLINITFRYLKIDNDSLLPRLYILYLFFLLMLICSLETVFRYFFFLHWLNDWL